MKIYLSKLGTYLLHYIAAIWAGMLVVIILKIPFDLISPGNLLHERIFAVISQLIGSSIYLFISFKKLGYKNSGINLKETVICTSVIFVFQQIITAFITSAIHTNAYLSHFTGGASTLAQAVFLGSNEANIIDGIVQNIPTWSYHVFMLLICFIIYIPIMLLGEHIGAKNRLRDRNELGIQ